MAITVVPRSAVAVYAELRRSEPRGTSERAHTGGITMPVRDDVAVKAPPGPP